MVVLLTFKNNSKGLGQQLGLNGTLQSQLGQQLSAVNITQLAQKLNQALDYIP